MKTSHCSTKSLHIVHVFCAAISLFVLSVSAFAQNTNTFPASGNAGIGTTSPSAPLTITTSGDTTDGTYYSTITVRKTGDTNTGLRFDKNSTALFRLGTDSSNNFSLSRLAGTGAPDDGAFYLNQSGNVGIGTTSPVTKFQLNYNNNSTTFVNGTDFTALLRNNNTSTNNWVGFGFAGNRDDGTSRLAGSIGAQMTSHANGSFASDLVFTVTGAGEGPLEVLRMKSSGKVGIGTTSPGSLLQIANAAQPTFTVETTGTTGKGRLTAAVPDWVGITQNARFDGANWHLDNTSLPGWLLKLDSRGFADIFEIARFSSGTNPRTYTPLFTIDSAGDVGIGTNTLNVAYKLDVNGAINATALNVNGSPVNGSQWANGSGHINFTSGKVGIGTTSPGFQLDVESSAQWAARFKKTDATHGGILIESAAGYNPNLALSVNGSIKWYMNSNVAQSDSLQFWESTGANPRFTLTQAGNVGIGTTAPPAEKLEVNGNLKLSGTGNINASGTIEADNIKAKYQDLAEWVPSSEQLAAGTVVVLDTTKSNQVISSNRTYDTRVAGVISAQPGITLGEGGEGKVLVATTGRVKVKVDASRGAIQIGDLLVTSDIPGVAMKSEVVDLGGVQFHRPGTIIGKALEPLAKGSGEILVLLSLQ